jgi:hypothetical protein
LRKRPGSLGRRKKRLRTYNTIRCPLAGHQVGWCRGLCTPIDDVGLCGRIAPHSLQGRTQRAIAAQQADEAAKAAQAAAGRSGRPRGPEGSANRE